MSYIKKFPAINLIYVIYNLLLILFSGGNATNTHMYDVIHVCMVTSMM